MRARWGAVVVCSLLVLVGCAPPASPSTWQYQLSGRVDTSVDAPVYIVDGFDVEASVVDELHDAGRKVVCYINAGAYEQWRRDASAYPEEVVGEPLADWPGEAWLDIRRLDLLEPIIAARRELLEPFVRDGKMVLHVEYDLPLDEFCPVTAELGFSSIRKPLTLTAPVEPCPAP